MTDAQTPSVAWTLDGRFLESRPGTTILEAADEAGEYIPRLCWAKDLSPAGACRVCTVRVNGRYQAACTQPLSSGMVVENDTEELHRFRSDLIDLLFVEGNHFCMFCEKSGACELQALAYRLGITAPRFPFTFPDRPVDATHPDLWIDRNRCILCGRCARASDELDGKNLFGFVGRGSDRRIEVNARTGLGETNAEATDRAVDACPTGALLRKRNAFRLPVGQRPYDRRPIGSASEQPASDPEE